jgi:hypothetical protein
MHVSGMPTNLVCHSFVTIFKIYGQNYLFEIFSFEFLIKNPVRDVVQCTLYHFRDMREPKGTNAQNHLFLFRA